MTGKPGISSFDKFATGHAIRSELRTMGGNLLGLNSAIMKLSNGDDESRAVYDPAIGARAVKKVSSRKIGGTASILYGGLGPESTPARNANILGNPYMRRYEEPGANGSYNFGLNGSPAIGDYYDVYESENHRVRFLDETAGRDLLGYTHLEAAAQERNEAIENDNIYLRSTYSVFGDLSYPFDNQDIERFRLGPKRYSPAEPYVLKPLETELIRRTINGDIQQFGEKFEAVVEGREPYRGSMLDMWDYMGSHVYLNLLNGIMEHGLYNENYEYDQKNRNVVYDTGSMPQSDYSYFLDVETDVARFDYWNENGLDRIPDKEIKGLLGKTNRMFYEGKIRSLANRFATLNGNNEGRPDFLNTATDHTYGLSRGRNLRKLNLTYENGYPNPYCRVWTTHYQYSKYKNLIRGKWANEGDKFAPNMLGEKDQLMRPNKGYERLKTMSSLDPENGRPIFAPYYVNDRDTLEEDSIKRCMFSIENLAWKDIIPNSTLIRKDKDRCHTVESDDVYDNITAKITHTSGIANGFGMTLTKEQRGPNGGRIMWFPPYNLKFSEQANAQWNSNEFIGRGEKMYTYVNSERTGTLSFSILVDHPSIINEWARGGKVGKTGNKADPLSKDEMILRYFAGCDSLEFNPRGEYDVPFETERIDKAELVTNENTVEEKKVTRVERPKTQDTVPALDADMTFYSVFYYPNNYSAEDFNKGNKPGGATAGLDEMFEKGKRSSGVGYERGNIGSTGMTYNNGYPNGAYVVQQKGKYGSGPRTWFYPVDTRVDNEVLTNPEAYYDKKDFGLNTSLYGTYWSDVANKKESEIIDYLNKGNQALVNNNTDNLKAAKEYVDLTESAEINQYLVPAYNFYKGLNDVITKLNAASKNSYKYVIEIEGYASSHGYGHDELKPRYVVDVSGDSYKVVTNDEDVKSNEILAENRAAVIESWIRSLPAFDFVNGRDSISHRGNGQIASTSTRTESDFPPKAARAAKVTLKIIRTKTDITDAQEYDDIEEVVTKTVTETHTENSVDEWEVYDTAASDDYKNQTYDDEYAYFKQINENDDMVKRYISDKVDYFDPAFHSITPEGFNARLTFLHQCLRQGPTISSSDLRGGGNYGAGNLSFGRAPFCVLRIGDFFNTKICIQNINIDYDTGNGVQWDLNPEGIGLQPMIANVNITFTFLGGSDLSGPISRLQNAVSYNFYANTSVYDRRADYRDKLIDLRSGDDDTAMSWSPLMLSKKDNKNVIEHVPFNTTIKKTKKE